MTDDDRDRRDARPSLLEADRWAVTGDERLATLRGDPAWDAHLAATAPLHEVPAWVLALDARPRRRRWWAALAGALATAAVLLALIAVRPPGPYVGDKGVTAAVIHVAGAPSGGAPSGVTVWDGQTPLLAGDRFRVELADLPAGAPWFAVVLVEPGERPVVLATGEGDGLVDGAWALDAPARGAELIVLAADRDLAGQPPEALLELPAAARVPLR
jgi:hypothetical protein